MRTTTIGIHWIVYGLIVVSVAAAPLDESEIHGRIISGTEAAKNQFPWQVILKRDEWDDLLCGGSIISANWVLTAAHCAYGRDSLYLMFGTNDLNDEDALNMTATELYVHPDYNDKMNNDVALVRLPQTLTFSSSIQAINLVSAAQATNSFVGTVATIAGFGLMDDEYLDFSESLLYAQVQVIDNAKCTAIFGSGVVLSSTMCADGLGGTNMSTCSGDSGGPMIIWDSSASSYVQIGINSFVAEDRCTYGLPSGYVRLTSFLTYIANITGLPVA